MTNLTDLTIPVSHEDAEAITIAMLKADADMLWSAYTDGDLEAGLDLDSVCDVLRYYGFEWQPPQDVYSLEIIDHSTNPEDKWVPPVETSGLEIHEGSDNVFLDLGFDEEEAEKLLKQCREGWE